MHFKSNPASSRPETTAGLVIHPTHGQPDDLLRLKHARNRARTQKNSSKVEHYLTEVEKAHGLTKAWAFRERLERGHVTLDELMRR